MEFLIIVYLIYMVLALYFLSFYILLFVQNRKQIFEYFKPERDYSLSIVIPCYNEEKSIAQTIKGHLKSDYKGLKKIIVVDDCSTDNSFAIIKKYSKLYPGRVIACKTPKNTGRAAGSKNYGARFVKTELIGFSDADSFPAKDATRKMVGFFNNAKMGAVTSRVLVKHNHNLLSKMQRIEYKIMAFTRKMLGFVDSIYVTNGPLSIYRKTAFDEVGGFNMKNLTEDIEITWNFVKHGWKVEMCIPSVVYTVAPDTLKVFFKQRIRWNVGGLQTIVGYFPYMMRCGMLGRFIMPFFILSWLLGIVGFSLLLYRIINYFTLKILVAKMSVAAQVAVISVNDLSLNPSLLLYYGAILFLAGLFYTLIALYYLSEKNYPRHRIYDIFIYSFFYLLVAPPLLLTSIYQYIKGKNTW